MFRIFSCFSLNFLLQDSLFELVQYGQIPASLGAEVMKQFDLSINEALSAKTKNRVNFHSEKLHTYRFCDNVWTFLLKNCEFKEGHTELVRCERVKIVACDAKDKKIEASSSNH